MYRILINDRNKKAYAVKCEEEIKVNPDGFIEAIEEWVKKDNDVIIFCHDLGKLHLILSNKYEIEFI